MFNQVFEIIRRAHFPPTLVSSQPLESSLEPNWLPPMDTMADEWDLMKEWAFCTVKRTRLLILPSFNKLLNKNTSSSPRNLKFELGAIYKGLAERLDEEGIKLLDGRT